MRVPPLLHTLNPADRETVRAGAGTGMTWGDMGMGMGTGTDTDTAVRWAAGLAGCWLGGSRILTVQVSEHAVRTIPLSSDGQEPQTTVPVLFHRLIIARAGWAGQGLTGRNSWTGWEAEGLVRYAVCCLWTRTRNNTGQPTDTHRRALRLRIPSMRTLYCTPGHWEDSSLLWSWWKCKKLAILPESPAACYKCRHRRGEHRAV